MEPLVFLFVLLLLPVSSALDHSLITVSVPPVSRVLLLTGPKGQYMFHFSEASEACVSKNLTMASRSQLQTALDHGLEACRFGWVLEQVAVVPRLSSVSNCGTGKTGLVTWRAPLHQRFGVWCFNQTDSNKDDNNTNTASQTSTFYPTIPQKTTTFTTAAALTTAITSITATTATTTIPTTSESTTKASSKTTTRTWIPKETIKAAYSEPVSTQFTTTTSESFSILFIHSFSTEGSTSKPTLSSVTVKTPRQRAVSTALISFCVIVLVLAAGGALLYFKCSEWWVWPHVLQKDDIETETWKQTCSEMELQEEAETEGAGQGEGRRCSSETMLYVNHEARTD